MNKVTDGHALANTTVNGVWSEPLEGRFTCC